MRSRRECPLLPRRARSSAALHVADDVAYQSTAAQARVGCCGHDSGRTHAGPRGVPAAQDELVEARNRLARAIAGAAMSGMTKDEIVDLTGYPADVVLRICTDAGISEGS
jgi:hypothetical protein